MKMKLLICAVLSLASSHSTSILAGEEPGWVLGPAFKDGWSPRFTLALTASYMDADNSGASGDFAPGAELSLDCPWFSPPVGVIRQQFNYNYYNEGDLKITSFEINPRYYMNMSPALRVGFGPGFGYLEADADVGEDEGMWSYQVGADLEYRRDRMFYGFGVRYQGTENETVGVNDKGADNWLAQFKVGVNF